ncbi:hypothetical protein ED733_008606 [Metarhizium rileyi]|uniref:HAD-like domain protein n=1 Tax=Metarhizium rileyi (strain RCEF 4871) TaxID=1649241 RepID=A0A5C6GPV3_METRR|nr:hypothetical protein ED733_008606 [Metarhizium rileyi]
MDGLLLDTENIYTHCVDFVLDKYGKGPLPWTVKAKLQGRPGPAAVEMLLDWAQLPISKDEYLAQLLPVQKTLFSVTKPLPGVVDLLSKLSHPDAKDVHIALATSSHRSNYELKTSHLNGLFSKFKDDRRVLGDDTRLQPGRGKPLPDIFLLALKTINDSLPAGERPISPEECLVFEDSVPGVEAGRRAGMRVVWVPHEKLKEVVSGKEEEILAGRAGQAGDVDMHQVGEIGDGWAEELPTLEAFDFEKYGIAVPSA